MECERGDLASNLCLFCVCGFAASEVLFRLRHHGWSRGANDKQLFCDDEAVRSSVLIYAPLHFSIILERAIIRTTNSCQVIVSPEFS